MEIWGVDLSGTDIETRLPTTWTDFPNWGDEGVGVPYNQAGPILFEADVDGNGVFDDVVPHVDQPLYSRLRLTVDTDDAYAEEFETDNTFVSPRHLLMQDPAACP